MLETVPDDPTVLTIRAALALDRDQLEVARGYLERALQVPASEEDALFGLLKVHYLTSNTDEALTCAERLLELNPGNFRALAMQADLLASQGRVEEGIASARAALEVNPTLIPVREWLVEQLGRAGRTEEQQQQTEILRRMRTAVPPM